jgi:hypothetical protein
MKKNNIGNYNSNDHFRKTEDARVLESLVFFSLELHLGELPQHFGILISYQINHFL